MANRKPSTVEPTPERPKLIKAMNKAWYRAAHSAKRQKKKAKHGNH